MYDILMIGGGPAGLTAGIYACRGGLKAAVIEKMFAGGQVTTTYELDNIPGFSETISGVDYAMKLQDHAAKFNVETIYGDVTKLELEGDIKKVYLGEEVYEAKTVVLAMGAVPSSLNIPGETELRGKGVSYCATCDGAFFKSGITAVIGGGDVAVEDALYLARFCEKVYLIHRRDELRANKTLQKKLFAEKKIEPIWNSKVSSINGQDKVSSITVGSVDGEDSREVIVDGVFIAVGSMPQSQIVKGIVNTDEKGSIITDQEMRTNINGVFAAGDIRQKPLRQIITAEADGAIAAFCAEQYILNKE